MNIENADYENSGCHNTNNIKMKSTLSKESDGMNYGHMVAIQQHRMAWQHSRNIMSTRLSLEMYMQISAVTFAVEEINQDSLILPNITLGFQIFDSCYSEARALQGAIWMLSGRKRSVPNYSCQSHSPVAGIVGDYTSANSIPLARILGLYRYPQISSGSMSDILSDKLQFPSFLRTIPNGNMEDLAITKLIMYFGWSWTGIIASEDDYGQIGSQNLKKKISEAGGCVAFLETISKINFQRKIPSIVELANNFSLLHYVKKVNFRNKAGQEVLFDDNGDPPAIYGFDNQQMFPDGTIHCECIGNIDLSSTKNEGININNSAIMWKDGYGKVPRSVCSEPCPSGYRKASRPGEPICCFDCVPCSMGEITNHTGANDCMKCPEYLWSNSKREKCVPKVTDFLSFEDSLGSSLAGLSLTGSFITLSILCIFIRFRNTPIVKANNREVSYVLLISLLLCFLCSLIFIGHPMKTTCLLRQSAFGVIFSVSISSVLAKTLIVVIAFNATKPSSNLKNRVGSRKIPSSIIVSSSMLQIIICIIWLSSATPFPQNNMNSVPGKIIIECNEGSAVMFYCMLGYLGILSGICFVVAFLARSLPDRFNEAKYITFSMLVFISVWLSFIPAYLSTTGKTMAAVEIFAILASTTGLIICIFMPKCYIILLRPDMNTREKVTGN
ncbi:vomeronasal type-2 receptor 26-like [Protopterus annectens]|uniref:vomeronasal type-2 receptor 26-like n=1 Tax=Protopterus annectens TaxID=7888 RepID=UPI001CFB1CAC|nr:vomeronasal type-2 receptor 26-like [Protopterus annectens]